MSRSYKKHPGFYDRNPFMKAKANEKVRHYRDLSNGNAYRKITDPWDIHDHKQHIWTRSDLIGWQSIFGQQFKKWPCFKELCKTKMYRDARSK